MADVAWLIGAVAFATGSVALAYWRQLRDRQRKQAVVRLHREARLRLRQIARDGERQLWDARRRASVIRRP